MEHEDASKLDFVKVEGPDVFFYCDVSVESVAELCAAVKKIERDYYETVVRIHIHSDGGDLHSGLAAMDFLKSCGPVWSPSQKVCVRLLQHSSSWVVMNVSSVGTHTY